MDLTKATKENIVHMIEAIKDKLRMANVDAMDPHSYSLEHYEDLLFMYNMIMKRDSFTPNEMQAIVEELGQMRSI